MTDWYTPPRIGQIWKDNDPRISVECPRLLMIEWVDSNYTDGQVIARTLKTGRTTRIAIKRLRPTSNGYVLVKESILNA